MGNFFLNLSEEDGHKAFSKRHTSLSKLRDGDQTEACLGVDADDLRVLGHVDPYADELFLEKKLETLSQEISDRIKDHEDTINKEILKKTRKSQIEPWMNEMVLCHRDQDRTLRFLYDLNKMVDRAIAANGSIVFLGD